MAMALTIVGAATVSLSFMRLLDMLEHPQKKWPAPHGNARPVRLQTEPRENDIIIPQFRDFYKGECAAWATN